MIETLRDSEITINGRTYTLELVQDDCITVEFACLLCYYRDWYKSHRADEPCSVVHECGRGDDTYFILH